MEEEQFVRVRVEPDQFVRVRVEPTLQLVVMPQFDPRDGLAVFSKFATL